MQIHWIINRSKYAQRLVIGISVIPLLLSLLLQKQPLTVLFIFVLTTFFYPILADNILAGIGNKPSTLSWRDGLWNFQNEIISIEGEQSSESFAMGLIIYLSIEAADKKTIDLWFFSDAISATRSKDFDPDYQQGVIDNDCCKLQGWRQLHSCFHLS